MDYWWAPCLEMGSTTTSCSLHVTKTLQTPLTEMILNPFLMNNLQLLKDGLPYVTKNTININFKWAAKNKEPD